MSQPHRRLTSQRLSYNQNKIDTPSVMMTFTAARAERGLASLLAGPVIRGHDVRQFMQACLLAFTGAIPAVRADLDPALNSISVADPLPARPVTGTACAGNADMNQAICWIAWM